MRIAALLLVACKATGEPPTDPESESDADVDADADADADSDADTDLDCDTPYSTPDPGTGPYAHCVTGSIACGETVRGNNTGGSTHFGAGDYEVFWTCSGIAEDDDLGGPERVYQLVVPDEVHALEVRLRSCQRSWVMWHRSADSCPTDYYTPCGFAREGGPTDSYDSLLVGPLGMVHFVVEGFQNDGGNFELHVDCFNQAGDLLEF